MTRVCAIPYEFEFLCSLALLKVHAPRWSAYVFRMNKALSVCERCSMRDALLHSVPPHRGLRAHFTVFQLRRRGRGLCGRKLYLRALSLCPSGGKYPPTWARRREPPMGVSSCVKENGRRADLFVRMHATAGSSTRRVRTALLLAFDENGSLTVQDECEAATSTR